MHTISRTYPKSRINGSENFSKSNASTGVGYRDSVSKTKLFLIKFGDEQKKDCVIWPQNKGVMIETIFRPS